MRGSSDRNWRAGAVWRVLFVSTVFQFSLPVPGFPQATAQDIQTLSRKVTVTSEPPGATIWMKEGNTLTCTNTLTPGAVELKFHGVNDLKKVRLRKFGYRGQDLDIKFTDDKVNAALGDPAPDSFVVTDDRGPELKQLNAGLQKEFEKKVFASSDGLACAPFELDFVHVMNDKGEFRLGVAIILDQSFGGPAFRMASNTGTQDERRRKVAQAALEGGIADLFARLAGIGARFPNLKTVTIVSTYQGSEAYLDTKEIGPHFVTHTTSYQTTGMGRDGMMHVTGTVTKTFEGWTKPIEYTKVEDRAVERSIKIVMPAAGLHETTDKKAITDAVLATGEIDLGDERGSRHITPIAADKIQDAAEDGDLGMANALLRDHPDLVFSKDAGGHTPLHWAAAKNHKDVAELLLANKAEVSAQDDDGWTPLQLAAFKADQGLVELLLAKGADVNARNQKGQTPLELAALSGQKDKVELLLARGADVKARDNIGNTPLHAAALSGNTAVAELLLAKGADVNAKDNAGATPLGRIVREDEDENEDQGQKAMAEFLRQHGGSCAQCASIEAKKLRTEWLTVAEFSGLGKKGGVEKVKAMLDQHPDLLESKDKYGRAALNLAAVTGSTNVVEFLLARGANPNTKDDDGWTPLMRAAEDNHPETAEALIAKGADVNAEAGPLGWTTPLSLAREHSKKVEAILLRHGAHEASIGSEPASEAKTNTSEIKPNSETQPKEAETKPSSEIQPKEAEIKLPDDWFGLARYSEFTEGGFERLKAMLAEHPDLLETSDGLGFNALIMASVSGSTKVVEFLLAKGANVNAKDVIGKTALMMAADVGHAETAEVLIAKGANVNAKDDYGRTALAYAKQHNDKKMEQILRQHGARK